MTCETGSPTHATKFRTLSRRHIPTAQVRALAQPPFSFHHRQVHIVFRYPSYDDCNDVLFKLHAADLDNDGQPSLLAQCAIDARRCCEMVAT